MAGDPNAPDMRTLVSQMFGYGPHPQANGEPGKVRPPSHWLDEQVQLQNNQRSVSGTIPAFMCNQMGVDKDNPPEVNVFFDTHTGLVMFDLGNNFEVPQEGGL